MRWSSLKRARPASLKSGNCIHVTRSVSGISSEPSRGIFFCDTCLCASGEALQIRRGQRPRRHRQNDRGRLPPAGAGNASRQLPRVTLEVRVVHVAVLGDEGPVSGLGTHEVHRAFRRLQWQVDEPGREAERGVSK